MNTESNIVRIRFEDLSVAEAGQRVTELREDLLDLSPDIEAKIVKDDPSTQDFGTTLILFLGAPAVVIIARGIADYLRRRAGRIIMETDDGVVIAEGITSADAPRIAEALAKISSKKS